MDVTGEVLQYTQAVKVIEHIFSFLSSGREHTSLTLAKSLGSQLQNCDHLDPLKWELKSHSSHNHIDLFNWIKTHIKPKDFLAKDEVLDWLYEKMKIKEKEKLELENYETTVALSTLFLLEKESHGIDSSSGPGHRPSFGGHSSTSNRHNPGSQNGGHSRRRSVSPRRHSVPVKLEAEHEHSSKGQHPKGHDKVPHSSSSNPAHKVAQRHSLSNDTTTQHGDQHHRQNTGAHKTLAEWKEDFKHYLFKCTESGSHGNKSNSVEGALNYHLQKDDLKKALTLYLHDHRPSFNLHTVCPEADHNWREYVTMHLENPFTIYAAARKFHVIIHVISLARPHVEEIRMYPHGHIHGHSERHVYIGHCGGKIYVPLLPLEEEETPVQLSKRSAFKEYLKRIEELEIENVELRRKIRSIEIDSLDEEEEDSRSAEEEKQQLRTDQTNLKQKHSENNKKIDKLRGGLHRENLLHPHKEKGREVKAEK